MTEPLRQFVDSVLNNKLRPEEYEQARARMGFRRELDGRVSLRSREGRWYSVRPDMQVPGFLLMRDQRGDVFFLPPYDGDRLEQLDLSDDVVVAELFSSTAWQDVMEPLSVPADQASWSSPQPVQSLNGQQYVQLRLSEREFREVVSLLGDADELELPQAEGG